MTSVYKELSLEEQIERVWNYYYSLSIRSAEKKNFLTAWFKKSFFTNSIS